MYRFFDTLLLLLILFTCLVVFNKLSQLVEHTRGIEQTLNEWTLYENSEE